MTQLGTESTTPRLEEGPTMNHLMEEPTMTQQLQASASVDEREALYNERAVGAAYSVQVPAERITRLHGILFDLDPKLLAPGNPLLPPSEDVRAFHEGARPLLDRHPLARFAEARLSGTGLHLILWLEPAVELRSAADQGRWGKIVRCCQSTLPVDPDCPGITAVTRPVGSVNGKNGARVEVLQAGQPLDPGKIEEFVAGLAQAPFRGVALPLLGSERVSPCPVCRGEGTRLDVGEHVGFCYGSCSKVDVGQLFDVIFEGGADCLPPPAKVAAPGSGKTKRIKKSQLAPLPRQIGRRQVTEIGSRVELN